ncbi:hypothetical protein OSTOST_12327 [Ostertagia ostertagi]
MQHQRFSIYKVILLLIYGCCFWFLIKHLLWSYVTRLLKPYYHMEYADLLDRMSSTVMGYSITTTMLFKRPNSCNIIHSPWRSFY